MEQLGQGGMGVVYRAVEENLSREVALKIVAPLYAHDPEFRERFSREARSQASLESAHVVAVYAHGEEDGYLYIASQLIVDGDLGRLIRTAGVPPLVDALSVIEQVASGLADAHEAGLVHRDIKPGNVLVRIRGNAVRAYLADFGIARRMDAASTRFGSSAVGTPTYMAPELHGGAAASFVTDVYSLGCLMWVALTGTPPFTGQTDYQIVAAHVTQEIPQLAGTSPMVQATNRILRLAMAKEPSQRYPTAAAMRADLQAALRLPHTPGAAVPEARGGTALRPASSGTPSRHTHERVAPPSTPPPSTPPPSTPPPSTPPPSTPPPTGLPPALARTAPPGHDRRPSTARRSGRTRLLVAAAVAAMVAVAGGIAAAAVVGDGGDDGNDDPPSEPTAESSFLALPPEEILRTSEKEMNVLDSVLVTSQFPDGKKNVSIRMTITSDGDCTGTMSYLGRGTAQVLRKDGRIMIKPDALFLVDFGIDNPESFLQFLDGRWLEFTDDPQQFESVCDLDEFLERDGRDGATATNEGVVSVQGEDAVKVRLQEGSKKETYYVMVAEPHYLLRLNETKRAWFEYSEFDEEVTIELPAESDILKDSDIGPQP
ncbi:serine/threonine-protein kinase [Nocardioides bizhenqiangii]|uniref:non-specific serine/threonine protein kinase n=1 Tax=Nocardioides bizhenqiangii TaxID=3095076 RepID=A0ABZ0ZPJ7_9ACTN|nr:serine/threonine-protein kinase [Nocardioides sp. HM61]WQQ26291.1 serine/threonine-protein kinase [Nocardioides sp. HM61]